MDSFLLETVYFGIVISLLSYWIAVQIRKLLPYPIFNPLLISAVISIGILIIFDIDFDTYNKGAQFITFLLTPATVCLAVPLYKQVQILIKHLDAILISLFSGCLAGIVSIFIMCLIMKADPVIYYSLLPKSITTAIAIGVSDKLGGNSTITVGIVIITGILGAIIAKSICKLFKIKHPVAIGLALGNSAHAIGTSKALELEIRGFQVGILNHEIIKDNFNDELKYALEVCDHYIFIEEYNHQELKYIKENLSSVYQSLTVVVETAVDEDYENGYLYFDEPFTDRFEQSLQRLVKRLESPETYSQI